MSARPFTPHAYQVACAKHIIANTGAGIFAEPGLGKTAITLMAVKALLDAGQVKGVLIVAPLRVCYSVWPQQVAGWDAFSGLKVALLHGKGKDAALASKADVYVVNYDGLKWLGEALAKRNGALPFDMLVLDESTKVKHGDTLRFKTLKALRPAFKRVVALTGTPAPNGAHDLWGQVYMLDAGERLGRFVTHFRRTFFDEVRGFGYSEWKPRRDTGARVQGKIADICRYLKAEDYLSMPRLTFNDIEVDLPSAARKVYAKVEADFFATLGDATVSAAHAAAAGMKLRQVCGGHVYDGEHEAHTLHTAKVDALLDLVEEQEGEPLLVAVGFKHEADAIRAALKAKLGIDAPYLGGGISPQASDRIAADWNAGKLPVLLAHPTSVAHGLNLQAGGHCVAWFTLSWNLEEYLQFNGRVYRQGQPKPVIVHHLVARDTIDQRVAAKLRDKDGAQRSLLAGFREEAKRGSDNRALQQHAVADALAIFKGE
jgi:SNF2 family DNA or RNA helicase